MSDLRDYKLGLKPSPRDDRDFLFAAAPHVELPTEYLPQLPQLVFDQKDSSECAACAVAYVRWQQEHDTTQSAIPVGRWLSPSYVYSADRRDDEIYEGMTLRAACREVLKKGICLWEEFAGFMTLSSALKYYTANSRRLDKAALPFRVSSYYKAEDEAAIKTAIMNTKAVIIGINVPKTFYFPDFDGVVRVHDYDLKFRGGHAVVINGWTTINGVPHWRIHNSWGASYGKDGEIFMSFEDLSKIMMDGAYVLVDEIHEQKFKESIVAKKNTPLRVFLNKIRILFKRRF